MTNIYWPVYKNLEEEVIRLSYNIHIDDNQLNVYSSKISDLILRSAVEIESLSKELYRIIGGKKSNPKYDEDALKELNKKWVLKDKVAIISSPNCFQTTRIIKPFQKVSKRKNGKLTFGWNLAYQSLKHNRAENLKKGNIKILFEILSALYIINLYYKDQVFTKEYPLKLNDFPSNLGSDLFSVKLHTWSGYHDSYTRYIKKDDFHECVYLTKYTQETIESILEHHKRIVDYKIKIINNHPEYKAFLRNNKNPELNNFDHIWKNVLSLDAVRAISREAHRNEKKKKPDIIEAVVNKNSI